MNINNDESIKEFFKIKNGDLYYVIHKKHNNKRFHPPRFIDLIQKDLTTADEKQYSNAIDVSHLRVFTFLVINNGINPVKCQVELSPDGIIWDSFNELELTIASCQKMTIIPQYFLRYARIKYLNDKTGFDSVITIWFQGQRLL